MAKSHKFHGIVGARLDVSGFQAHRKPECWPDSHTVRVTVTGVCVVCECVCVSVCVCECFGCGDRFISEL
jgi:hypothetical protein